MYCLIFYNLYASYFLKFTLRYLCLYIYSFKNIYFFIDKHYILIIIYHPLYNSTTYVNGDVIHAF